ncbi:MULTISPECIES: hypothetical protein [Elizabethkingia]|uniref:Uncharacterized protein n=2 Tax=Weeksellaceae TaxID=2762318 RepID=A0AAJ3NEA7_9FLAO|nr:MULTISPECIES: hypothetical protein [Elizabethkingia]AQW92917.1 hypothetical protein BBD30_01265 [Elizabethkingia anophelis]AQX09793.1 hypothetical protein BBD34_14605 [Elizabethkingia ursingii]OPB61471.1 hypothetical protein BAS07_16995 [Elizabethkingia anophelis]OPB78671.1 hypothetical protein BAY32_00585 [Elizabethkingia ursingii]OPB92830.1 hypothetical protein BB021_00030 [Elizabethkingia ursingii]
MTGHFRSAKGIFFNQYKRVFLMQFIHYNLVASDTTIGGGLGEINANAYEMHFDGGTAIPVYLGFQSAVWQIII